MDKSEIKKELEMPLPELYKYLKRKYGSVPENYFMDVNCTRKSTKNGRGNEGLFVHHDYEYDPANPLVNNLSDPAMARQFDYMYQHAENLTYCNYIEHLIIHIKICSFNRFFMTLIIPYFPVKNKKESPLLRLSLH